MSFDTIHQMTQSSQEIRQKQQNLNKTLDFVKNQVLSNRDFVNNNIETLEKQIKNDKNYINDLKNDYEEFLEETKNDIEIDKKHKIAISVLISIILILSILGSKLTNVYYKVIIAVFVILSNIFFIYVNKINVHIYFSLISIVILIFIILNNNVVLRNQLVGDLSPEIMKLKKKIETNIKDEIVEKCSKTTNDCNTKLEKMVKINNNIIKINEDLKANIKDQENLIKENIYDRVKKTEENIATIIPHKIKEIVNPSLDGFRNEIKQMKSFNDIKSFKRVLSKYFSQKIDDKMSSFDKKIKDKYFLPLEIMKKEFHDILMKIENNDDIDNMKIQFNSVIDTLNEKMDNIKTNENAIDPIQIDNLIKSTDFIKNKVHSIDTKVEKNEKEIQKLLEDF
jgi:hypothetical protein